MTFPGFSALFCVFFVIREVLHVFLEFNAFPFVDHRLNRYFFRVLLEVGGFEIGCVAW